MRGFHRLLSATALAAAALVVAVPPAAAQDACEKPAETKSITVMADWIPWSNQGPMFTAINKGYYQAEGIEVKVISPANPADPIKLVARERVQFSMTYVPEVMLSRETGIPVVSAAVALYKLSSGLTAMGDENIKKPADLKGKILGVGPKQDAQAFLDTILEAGGLTRKDVQIVDPGFGHISYLMTKKVAAAHTLEYAEHMITSELAKKEGKALPTFLRYSDFGVPKFYYQLYVAPERWITKNGATTCRFLRATQKGIEDYFGKQEWKETNKWVHSKNEIFTLDQHNGMAQAIATHWQDPDGKYWVQKEAVWKEAQEWAIKRKLITIPEDPKKYFTNRYVPKS
ncbi:MAG: hypothetical protein FJX61_13105 [Alphaproteobacteria bacterium]|nr:hypothetical protein [Alphaproteobacteria bacterium]